MYENGLGVVIDHTHHFTGDREQLAEIVQPLGTLKGGQKTKEKKGILLVLRWKQREREREGGRERERERERERRGERE